MKLRIPARNDSVRERGESLCLKPRGRLEVVVRGSVPGEFVWHEPGAATRLIDAGASGGEVVEIEVK